MTTERDYKTAIRRIDELESALIEVDMYLAALNWWHIGNIGKAGEVLGEAIGWDRVRILNEKYAPKCRHDFPAIPASPTEGRKPVEPSVSGSGTCCGGDGLGDNEPQLIGTEFIEKKFRDDLRRIRGEDQPPPVPPLKRQPHLTNLVVQGGPGCLLPILIAIAVALRAVL